MLSKEIEPYVESCPYMVRDKQVILQNRVEGTQDRVIDQEIEGEKKNHISRVVVFNTKLDATYLSYYGVFRIRARRHMIVEIKP